MKAGQLFREGPKIECREVYEIWISTSYDQNKYRTKVKSINIRKIWQVSHHLSNFKDCDAVEYNGEKM